jgi:hypothetical protein
VARLRRASSHHVTMTSLIWVSHPYPLLCYLNNSISSYLFRSRIVTQELLRLRPTNGGLPACPEEYPQTFLTPALEVHETSEAVRVFRAYVEKLMSSDVDRLRVKKLSPCIIRTVLVLDSALQTCAHEGSERWHRCECDRGRETDPIF